MKKRIWFFLVFLLLLGGVGKIRGYAAVPTVFLEVYQLNENLVKVSCEGSQLGRITNGKLRIYYSQEQMTSISCEKGEGVVGISCELNEKSGEIVLAFATDNPIVFEGNFCEMTFSVKNSMKIENLNFGVAVEELACEGEDLRVYIGGTKYFSNQQTEASEAKAKLQKKIDEIKALKQSDYTKGTWAVLEQAMNNAEKVISNSSATEADAKAAMDALEKAKSSLKLQAEADREAAQKALEQAKQNGSSALNGEKAAYEKGQELYTDAYWNAYRKAYEALKTSLSGKDASAINNSRDALAKAKAALEEIRTVTAASIRTINRTGYEKAKLSIKKTKGAKAYLIFRSNKKNAGYRLVAMAQKTSYTDQKAKAGKTYYYKAIPVKAVEKKKKNRTYLPIINGYTNKIKSRDLENLVNRSGKAKSISIKKIGQLKITRSGQALTLKWAPIKDAKKIQVSYSANGKSGWKTIASANQNRKKALTTVKVRSTASYWYRVTYQWPSGEKSTKAVRK